MKNPIIREIEVKRPLKKMSRAREIEISECRELLRDDLKVHERYVLTEYLNSLLVEDGKKE